MKILAPIDGSLHSKKALEFACNLAHMFNAKLFVLNVIHDAPGSDTLTFGSASVTIEASQENLDKAGADLIKAAKKVVTESECRNAETIVRGGYPTQQILGFAKEKQVDIIVIGNRGLSDIKGLLLGSVSHKINNLAKCTCITVR